MAEKIIHIILTSACAFVIILVLGKAIGRKLISRITYFDFIVGVILGSIGARIALGPEESPILAAISAVVLTLMVVIIDFIDIKSINFRKLVDGEPIILISNGQLLNYNLKKARVTINKLMMQLREKDIFNIEDVAIASFETDGELTVLKKIDKQPLKTGDLNISKSYSGLMVDIIIDGEIIYDNLKRTSYDERWVKEQLRNQNIQDIKEVFYAGLNVGKLYVSKRIK